MGSIFQVKGTVYRNDSADIRLAVKDTETGVLVQRADIVRIGCRLERILPSPQVVANWSISVEDSISDGPIFQQQDPGWHYTDEGYNFFWALERGYLDKAPAQYRLIFEFELTGLRKGTHVVDLDVLAP